MGKDQQQRTAIAGRVVSGTSGPNPPMNAIQSLWWEQTRSDHSVLLLLRREHAASCQQLHYLQMVTEKLGKAYFWRSGRPPRKSHASFVRFLQALDDRPDPDGTRIAELLGFRRVQDFENWIPTITPLAYDLERLAPALAGDNGPNPEYPWPRTAPVNAPVSYEFAVWTQLTDSGRGRQLLRVIDAAVIGFPAYG
jgi:hypothetical protein